jgi:uncharacterized membrane protein YeaQ/YmgE (transglycosylase-associated protein family)
MINFIVWIVFGALAGWVASMLVGTDAQQGAVANIVVGIIGAVSRWVGSEPLRCQRGNWV